MSAMLGVEDRSATGLDEHAAGELERASVSMREQGDGPAAVATLLRAAELSPDPGDRTRRLAGAAFIGATGSAGLHDARELLTQVKALEPDPTSSLEAASAAACLLILTDGDLEPAQRLLAQAIDGTAERSPGVLARGAATVTLTSLCRMAQRQDWWTWRDGQLGRLGTNPHTHADPPLGMLMEDAPVQIPAALLDRLDRAVAGIAASSDVSEIIGVADAAARGDRLGGCREPLRRVVRGGGSTQTALSTLTARLMLALDAFNTGDWAEADVHARTASDLACAHGYGLPQRVAGTIPMLTAALRGDFSDARARADEMLGWALPRGVGHLVQDARYGLLLAALSEGDFDTAYRHGTHITPPGTLPRHQSRGSWVMLDLIEAALHSGRETEAHAHAACVLASGVAGNSSRTEMLVAACAALVAPDDAAVDHFSAALAVPGGTCWTFDHARVQLLFGERLRRMRESSRSRIHLSTAVESFERLGAVPWAERARKELRATGQSRARGAQLDRDTLTPQELEIAQLAAAGLSNKEIGQRLYLSHRTVGAHLYRVFPKLGITSRAALRDALASLAETLSA